MTDAELIDRLALAWRGVSTCSSCGMCQMVAREMLALIEQHLATPVYDGDQYPGPPACVGGQCGEE